MAARKLRPRHTDEIRAKIQTTQLSKRLTAHALGEIELSSTQIKAIEILLKKTLPDLKQTEVVGEGGGAIKSEEKITVEFVNADSAGK